MKRPGHYVIKHSLEESIAIQSWKLVGILTLLLTFTINYSFAQNCSTPDLSALDGTESNGLSVFNSATITAGNAEITGIRSFGGGATLDEDKINSSQTTGTVGIRQGLANSWNSSDFIMNTYSYDETVCDHSITIWDIDRTDEVVITAYNDGQPVSYTISSLGSCVTQVGNTFTSACDVQISNGNADHKFIVDFDGCLDQIDIKFYNFNGQNNAGGSYTVTFEEGCEENNAPPAPGCSTPDLSALDGTESNGLSVFNSATITIGNAEITGTRSFVGGASLDEDKISSSQTSGATGIQQGVMGTYDSSTAMLNNYSFSEEVCDLQITIWDIDSNDELILTGSKDGNNVAYTVDYLGSCVTQAGNNFGDNCGNQSNASNSNRITVTFSGCIDELDIRFWSNSNGSGGSYTLVWEEGCEGDNEPPAAGCSTPDLSALDGTESNGLSVFNSATITAGDAEITGIRTFGGGATLDEDKINSSQTTGAVGIRQGLANSWNSSDYIMNTYTYSEEICDHSITIWDIDRTDEIVITAFNAGQPVSYTISNLGSCVTQVGNTFTSACDVQISNGNADHKFVVDFDGCLDQIDIKFYNFNGQNNAGGSYTVTFEEGCTPVDPCEESTLAVDLGESRTICAGENLSLTALVTGAATCAPVVNENCTTPDLDALDGTESNGLSVFNSATITAGGSEITGVRTFGGGATLDEDKINSSQTTGAVGIRQGLSNSWNSNDYIMNTYSYDSEVCSHSITIWDIDRTDEIVITAYNAGQPVTYNVSSLGSCVTQAGNTFTSACDVQVSGGDANHKFVVNFDDCVDQVDIKFYNFNGQNNAGGSYTVTFGEGCETQGCSNTLASFYGNCDDPSDCLLSSGVSSCLTNVSGVCPTNGPNPYASCNNNIICIASTYNSWDVSMTAQEEVQIAEVEGDFWYPTDGSNAGGEGNLSSCPTSFTATVKFYVDGVLHSQTDVVIPENVIITKAVAPSSPINLQIGETLKVMIDGNPTSESCDLIELAGFRVNGCCSPVAPMEEENNTYLWSGNGINGSTTQSVVINQAGTYCVTVMDCNGCVTTDCVVIDECGASIGNFVFEDLNGNGIQDAGEPGIDGVTVMLLDGAGNMVAGVDPQTTDNGGAYNFSDLTPGNYKVKFTAPMINGKQSVFTSPNEGGDDAVDSDAVPMGGGSLDGMSQIITVANGDEITDIDAGVYVPVTIGNFVFEDLNEDGIQNFGEPGIDGVTVMLLDESGNMVPGIAAQTTMNGGLYEFTNVPPGSYKVKFTAPSVNGIFADVTQPNQGGNDAADSDAIAMPGGNDAMTEVITLVSGDEIDTVDAGYLPVVASLGNYVFEDANLNGVQDLGEAGIDGILVELLDGNGNPTGQSTTTANGGLYEFTGLAPGNYIVQFPKRSTIGNSQYSLTLPNQGGNDAADSDAVEVEGIPNARSQVVTLTGGDNDDSIDAGYFALATVGDFVFIDENDNDLQDGGDSPLPNVTVMLIGTDGFGNAVNITQITDANGEYQFSNVIPGSYEVKFTAPANYIFVEPNVSGNAFDDEDSDVDPNTGKTDLFTVNNGDAIDNIDAGLEVDASLPVQLLSFEAQLVNNSLVKLKWSTSSEVNNRHFVVERSSDGVDFVGIGIVNGNGTTNLVNHYSLDDLDPFYGANYYRLKQVDFDGSFEYSHVETVIISGDDLPDAIIYPNPTVRTTTLRVVTPFEEDSEVKIVDRLGRVLNTIIIEKGANSKQIDLSGYAAGTYYAYVTYNGHRTLVYSIVKIDE